MTESGSEGRRRRGNVACVAVKQETGPYGTAKRAFRNKSIGLDKRERKKAHKGGNNTLYL